MYIYIMICYLKRKKENNCAVPYCIKEKLHICKTIHTLQRWPSDYSRDSPESQARSRQQYSVLQVDGNQRISSEEDFPFINVTLPKIRYSYLILKFHLFILDRIALEFSIQSSLSLLVSAYSSLTPCDKLETCQTCGTKQPESQVSRLGGMEEIPGE